MKGKIWERRDIVLADEKTKSTVRVKLWGEKVHLPVALNSRVKVTNCLVDCFKDTTTLNTSEQSDLLVRKGYSLFFCIKQFTSRASISFS